MSHKYIPREQSTHLCECGCGRFTNIAYRTDNAIGWVNGQPIRFIHGHHKRRPAEERFWEKVNKDAPNGCWEWTGSLDIHGYGRISIGQTKEPAHRFSYALYYGPVPIELEVCHNCPGGDNPRCCNPAHLWLGTHAENMADRDRKSHPNRGVKNGQAKLTETQVVEIRRKFVRGVITYKMLATEYGVTAMTVANIITLKTWSHIP